MMGDTLVVTGIGNVANVNIRRVYFFFFYQKALGGNEQPVYFFLRDDFELYYMYNCLLNAFSFELLKKGAEISFNSSDFLDMCVCLDMLTGGDIKSEKNNHNKINDIHGRSNDSFCSVKQMTIRSNDMGFTYLFFSQYLKR